MNSVVRWVLNGRKVSGHEDMKKEYVVKKLAGALVCAVLGVPVVAQAQAPEADALVVKGSLDKDSVRKVIKKRTGQVRYCYERGLKKNPKLGGKVVVEFVIGKAGKVESTVLKSSELGDAQTDQCIAKKVKRWVFPKPKDGGVVIVRHPFVFKSKVKAETLHAIGSLEADKATSGFGGLGLSGTGELRVETGTFGIGSLEQVGTKGQATTAKTQVSTGKPVVKGSLDKEIIRRVVRQHRNEVRYCYEKELQKDPNLGGKVDVKFVIAATGKVQSAVVAGSTMGNAAVEGCIAKKVKRWVFPQPKGGGIVVVKYPFVFTTKKTSKAVKATPTKKPAAAKVVPGRPGVTGSLDKEIIRRVVRRHRNEIRYCYEKQLQKNPDLAGKVEVKFVISATGSVQFASVLNSTLGDDAVGKCITKRVKRWVFPEPKGGGIVAVKYPFMFSR